MVPGKWNFDKIAKSGENGTLILKDKPRTIEKGSAKGAISVPEINNQINNVFGK